MITFSHMALRRLTYKQRDKIIKLSDDRHEMRITTQFDLPQDYVAFELKYEGTATTIYGGIDGEGVSST